MSQPRDQMVPGLPIWDRRGRIVAYIPKVDPQNWEPVWHDGEFIGYRRVRQSTDYEQN